MSFSQAASFELGARTIQRVFSIVLAPFVTGKEAASANYFVDMLRIIRPVGGDVQGAVRCQPTVDQLQECRLDDATLVMAFLGPWVRKVQVDALQRTGWYLFPQYIDRIVHDEPQVANPGILSLQETVANPGLMDLDSHEVGLRVVSCLLDKRVAIAKANFKDDWCLPAKNHRKVQRLGGRVDAKSWPQLLECSLLWRR